MKVRAKMIYIKLNGRWHKVTDAYVKLRTKYHNLAKALFSHVNIWYHL